MSPIIRFGAIVIIGSAIHPVTVAGRDYFLTIGGGYEPQGNQVSLERNVAFFSQVLAEQRLDRPPHEIYFADGADSHRDLQYREPNFQCTAGRQLAIELFGDSDDLDIAYRNHVVADVRDATSPRRIRNYLSDMGRRMNGSDRLIIYATAHGGSGSDKSPHDTTIYTWNHQQFRAAQFAGWLETLPESSPVVMVMVQCYAGGFARTIFNDADPNRGLARQLRAGFFAQVHDRPAAGCTPEVDEESYQEYSSYFWAALAGHDRLGRNVGSVDFDGDGMTSFAEAHAYAVYESDTVDIPIRTSDAFLDYYSTDGTTSESPYDMAKNRNEPRRLPSAELVRAEGRFPELLATASAVDRAIVTRLAEKLQLDTNGSIAQIGQELNRVQQANRQARREAGRAASALRRARDRVKNELRREWPELEADLPPLLASFMAERSDEFEQTVTSMPGYRTVVRLAAEDERAQDKALDAKKDEALAMRLDRAVDRIVRIANLPHVASPQVVERFYELIALESGNLKYAAPAEATGHPPPSKIRSDRVRVQ